MELERRTQDSGQIVTEYAKAIRKLIKQVDSKRNWTEEQKIYFFTKGLKTDLSYALWPLLALKYNFTINMAIELAQRIEDNQRMHLGSTLPVFAPASVMVPAPQMAATSFATHIYDPNKQLIDRLTANLNENASQPEENSFYAFNLTDNDHDMNELAISTSDLTKKKKKAKVDFVLNPNKASTFTANNNEPPKTKVFKNSPKLEPSEIVQKSGPYFVVKDLMKTPAHITFGQLMTHPQFRKNLCKLLIPKKKTPKSNKHSHQAGLVDNSNVTPLICKAQVAGYSINLILNSESSISVIAKHFLEAIGRKINELSTQPITNVHGDKKKSIKTDMEVSKAKEYTIIVGNKWLKKAKALLDYELCELTIRCGKKSIVIKCCYWTTPPATKQNQEEEQSDKSDNDESNNEDQKEPEKTAELAYTIFTSNGKPLDNVKANKEGIIVNGKLICWLYYNIFRRTFDRKPGKKTKYSYWWHGLLQKSFENEPSEIQSLVVEQRKPSPKKKKIDIENLLARNSSVISKEGIILQRTSTNNSYSKYSQQLGLNNNHFSAESTFNFYINDKITDCLRGTVNIEFTRENFYTELFQHTSLPKNYNKDKERLQTPAVTPKQIQPFTWKKTRVELPTNPSYHYIPRSTINISSTGVFTSNTTSTFEQLSFQSKQKKAELLETYNFGNTSPWKITKSEKKEKKEESEDQKFTYQNLIPENLEIEILNLQT
ncbi:hypothetical protein G9A89_018434 [Geosiphon pyriformis]|nr:hypothetical protein G9A89_018434 [Geosiphon pyriformis]